MTRPIENNTENQTREEREQKEQNSRPRRDSRLRSRELAAPALRTDAGAPRIHVQPGAEFHIITPPTKIAKQWLADRNPIAVVAIFHKSEMGP